MNTPRFNRVAACYAAVVALAALTWAGGDKFIYDDTDLRDPMTPYVKPVPKPPPGVTNIVSVDPGELIRKIRDVLAMCTIDGLTVTKTRQYVCINERILSPGDRAIPASDVRIGSITEKEIVFKLENAEIRYTVTPLVTNAMMMSSEVPTKD